MGQTKAIVLATCNSCREETQYRRLMADLEAQWELEAALEDLTIGIAEENVPEFVWPASAFTLQPATV